MSFNIDQDLADMMLSAEGGVTVTIGGNPYQGIYMLETIDQFDTDSTGKAVFLRDLDLVAESVVHGTTVTIASVAYIVKGIDPDMSGLSRVKLVNP